MAGSSSTDLEVFEQMKRFDTSKAVILKAHRYLTDGHVQVVRFDSQHSEFKVLGTEEYNVRYISGKMWLCDCPSRQPVCAHVVAASLISSIPVEIESETKITPFSPYAFLGRKNA